MNFSVYQGEKYKKEIIQFFIPCSGNINLLAFRPVSIITIGGGGNFELKDDSIVAKFINFSNNAKEMYIPIERLVSKD